MRSVSNCIIFTPNDELLVGKGLILLLHGAPGVGKTSTAGELIRDHSSQNFAKRSPEGVAEMFGKPLFQITCGMFPERRTDANA